MARTPSPLLTRPRRASLNLEPSKSDNLSLSGSLSKGILRALIHAIGVFVSLPRLYVQVVICRAIVFHDVAGHSGSRLREPTDVLS